LDLVSFCKAAEMLDQINAQSTAIVPSDVPQQIADLYRLFLVLTYSSKPIVTGAFRKDTWQILKDLLVVAAGGEEDLARRPRAIFDICPTSPLKWSETASQNLIDFSKSGSLSAQQQANRRVDQLLANYPGPSLDPAAREELRIITAQASAEAGLPELPAPAPGLSSQTGR
jgi:trimethylamine:corrinoid methyltransferase-like protein